MLEPASSKLRIACLASFGRQVGLGQARRFDLVAVTSVYPQLQTLPHPAATSEKWGFTYDGGINFTLWPSACSWRDQW